MNPTECPHCGEMIEATDIRCVYCTTRIEGYPSLEFIRYPEDREFADDTRRIADIEKVRELSMGDDDPGWVTQSDLD